MVGYRPFLDFLANRLLLRKFMVISVEFQNKFSVFTSNTKSFIANLSC